MAQCLAFVFTSPNLRLQMHAEQDDIQRQTGIVHGCRIEARRNMLACDT